MSGAKGKRGAKDPPRLFVDMDGTLAVFNPGANLLRLRQKGYFENLEPMPRVVEAVRRILEGSPETEVYTLSSYLTDSAHALREKNRWLDRHLPELPKGRRIFCPCGADKKGFAPGGVGERDFLLDDYTKNLLLWQPPGRGIKLLNGLNHTRGTWRHDRVSHEKSGEALAKSILEAMAGARVYDKKPQKEAAKQQGRLQRAGR